MERPGRPADVVTEEIIEKVHDMILADRRTKARDVPETVDVSTGTAFNKLAMKKLSPRWVPRSRFFLFPNMKKWLAGKNLAQTRKSSPRQRCIYELVFIYEYYLYLESRQILLLEGLKKWQERWEKCIFLTGDYVEKYILFFKCYHHF